MINIFSLPIIKDLLKTFGKTITNHCNKCDSNRFDLILDNITGKKNKLCVNCWIHAKLFNQAALLWLSYYNIKRETLNKISEITTLRRVLKNILKGIAIFGVQMPFITGAPLSIVWNYTKKCNLKCSHCFSDSRFNQCSENELTTEQAKQVIDNLAENDVVTVNFCGGEPLTREDLFEVMKYAQDNDIYPSISTNAMLLTKDVCRKLYDSGVRSISISLDSINAKNHDKIRNVPGAFDGAVEGIKTASEFGKFDELIINTTLTDFTYKEIPQIYEFIKDLGATRFYVSRILPTGRGKYFLDHDVDAEKKREVMDYMASKFIQNIKEGNDMTVLGRGMPYFSRACHDMSNGKYFPLCEILTGYEPQYQDVFDGKTSELLHKLTQFFSGCATGLFYCGLDCDGNVIPCAPAGEIKLGKILERGLKDIWVNNPKLNRIRERSKVTGKCGTCIGKKFCGGCRLTAYGLTGDWLATDLSCPYN